MYADIRPRKEKTDWLLIVAVSGFVTLVCAVVSPKILELIIGGI